MCGAVDGIDMVLLLFVMQLDESYKAYASMMQPCFQHDQYYAIIFCTFNPTAWLTEGGQH
jgi:hypothetical protein